MLDTHVEYDPEALAAIAKERYGYETVDRMLDEAYREALMSVAHCNAALCAEPSLVWKTRPGSAERSLNAASNHSHSRHYMAFRSPGS